MKTVYLAGPISGTSYGECTDWREEAERGLKAWGIKGLSPMRGKAFLSHVEKFTDDCAQYSDNPLSSPRGIMTRDRYDATHCDVLLVNLLGATKVSIGTCMEIAWADAKRTPIVVAMEENKNPALLSDVDRAWLAAMIDGEGQIGLRQLTWSSRGALKNPYLQLSLQVSMTSFPIIEKIHSMTGVGSVRGRAPHASRRKPQKAWQAVAQEASTVLREIYPFLIEKKQQAALVIEAMNLKKQFGSSNLPQKGQKGARPKAPELVALEQDIFDRYRSACAGQQVKIVEPIVPYSNPHEHSMIHEAIGYRVDTLAAAIEIVRLIVGADVPAPIAAPYTPMPHLIYTGAPPAVPYPASLTSAPGQDAPYPWTTTHVEDQMKTCDVRLGTVWDLGR